MHVLLLLVIHNVQGCPRFARIAECGTCAHDNSGTPTMRKVNDRSAHPQYPPTIHKMATCQ